jgi:hypothetical protein
MHRREQSTFALHEHVPRWFPLVSDMSPVIHRYIMLTSVHTMACPGYSTHALLQKELRVNPWGLGSSVQLRRPVLADATSLWKWLT